MKKFFIFFIFLILIGLGGCAKQVTPSPLEDDCSKDESSIDCNIDEPLDPVEDTFVIDLVNQLTLEEKVGQMIQAERAYISIEQVAAYNIGSILSGGGSFPNNYDDSTLEWYEMYRGFQNSALESSSGIPLMYGIDAVHGNNNVYGSTIFPHNINLGMMNDSDLVFDIGVATASEMLTTGITWNFAPALSVVQDIRWGRTYEGFSESPLIHNNLTSSYIEGLQSVGVSATAKHYLADGGTVQGIDQGDVLLSETKIRNLHLLPYYEAIEADVDTVMVSYSSIYGNKMHGSEYWINDVLKTELGFEGFVVSDWNGIHQLPGDFKQQLVMAVNAGIDMLMEPYDWENAYHLIIEAVEENQISESRINDAVTRIIKIKYKRGLFSNPLNRFDEESNLYTEEHKLLAREVARKSFVLLKNEDSSLPLDNTEKIYIHGFASDNVGYLCGGWTTNWQGNTNFNIGVGTSIYDGINNYLSGLTGVIVNNMDDADTVIIVLSENPYAEGMGDNMVPTLTGITAQQDNINSLQIAQIAQSEGKNVVGILISGRPLLLEHYLSDFDSFVAVFLPGSEGGNAVSDVLFGDFDFTGKLAFTWPLSFDTIGYTVNEENYEEENTLFPFGYGLTYN